jgi:predicted ATPase
MIAELNVDGFKSLNEFKVSYKKGLNVIVGPNGSGKTNICQALNIVSSVPRGNLQNYLSSIGGASAIFSKLNTNKKEINISAKGYCYSEGSKNSKYNLKYTYTISLKFNNEVFSIVEKLNVQRNIDDKYIKILYASSNDGIIKCTYDKDNIGDCINEFVDETIKFKIDKGDSIWGILPKLFFVCYCIMLDIGKLRLINIDPNIAREPCDIIEYDKMQGNGKYLANELSTLIENANNKYELEALLTQSVPDFQDDISVSTPQIDFRRTIQIRNKKCEFTSANLSDGTIKLIGVLVAIINQDNFTVIIEELENYLHPNVNRLLINYLRETFKSNACILTSHSETILNLIHPDELIICEHKDGSTKCNRIQNINRISKAIETSGFGCGYHYVLGNLN